MAGERIATLGEGHITPVVPAVDPRGEPREEVVADGPVRARHLLLPQVENSLRHLLKLHGHDSSKIEEDGIEGDRSLNVLLTTFRQQLEAILGERLVWEMDSLLNFRPGPALRNELAHGKMHWNRFFSDEAIMACWLVYLLVILPIRPHWDAHVGPALRAMTSSSQV